MFKRIVPIIAVCALSFSSVFAEDGVGLSESASKPELELKTNSVNFNPFALVQGNINVNYEHLFGERHGLEAEGSFYLKGGAGFGIAYRHHYFKNDRQRGLNSPFWSLFAKYSFYPGTMTIENSSYGVDMSFLHIGLNVGRRWFIGNMFNIVFRLGYGYPVLAKFKYYPSNMWDGYDDSDPEIVAKKVVEGITKFITGIDGELSIGFAF